MDKNKIFNIIFSGAVKVLLLIVALVVIIYSVHFFVR